MTKHRLRMCKAVAMETITHPNVRVHFELVSRLCQSELG